jgi:hypothetical protein
MSGGSYNYTCYRVEEEYVGRMHDPELDDMMKGLVKVLKDLEWWQSSDIGEEDYRKTVQWFKDKWFGKRDERLRELIKTELSKVQEVLEKI